MSVWEITNSLINTVAVLAMPEREQENLHWWEQFGGDGSALPWGKAPTLEVLPGKGRSKPRPRADISPFMPGALVLSSRARDVLGGFLSRFGQLLEVSVDGTPEFFFNVTNLVACIDRQRSEIRPSGTIAKEVFDAAAVPTEAAVFKDPSNPGRIYVTEAGKSVLEQLLAESGVTGMGFRRVGD